MSYRIISADFGINAEHQIIDLASLKDSMTN
jgi:hypothetical protein